MENYACWGLRTQIFVNKKVRSIFTISLHILFLSQSKEMTYPMPRIMLTGLLFNSPFLLELPLALAMTLDNFLGINVQHWLVLLSRTTPPSGTLHFSALEG
jgi:hypothetical protein